MEISVELKVLVVRSGKKAKEIAEGAGISQAKLSKILNAQQVPDWADVVSISRNCGYEPELTFKFKRHPLEEQS